MATPLLACPLCSQPGFTSLESLRDGLVGAATRQIVCPVCNDILHGIDKFTIHLFSHFLQFNIQSIGSSSHKYVDQPKCNAINPVNFNQPKENPNLSKPFEQFQVSCSAQNHSTANSNQIINICSIQNNQIPLNASSIGLQLQQLKKKSIKPSPILRSVSSPNDDMSHIQGRELSQTENEKIVFNTVIDNSFENVALLESCGLKQNELGLISQVPDAPHSKPSNRTSAENDESGSQRSTNKESHCNRQATFQQSTSKTTNVPKCQLCGFTFPDEHILTLHKQLVHSSTRDMSIVSERKQFGCYLCSKEFKMRGSLMVHLRVAHGSSTVGNVGTKEPEPEARQFVCNTCGKSFKKDQHLNQHMKTHEGKQWSCDVCHKMFTTKYFLKKHNRLHTGEMPYSCNICSKTFTFQQSMHKHALYHRDDKPHQCTECNRSFKELSTLHNHRRIHTGEKPFSCETCGKCFRQRVSYLVHRRIHTGVTPYKCTACDKSFRYKVSERTHKCPSQPPGTVVRQTGELVQKLQQRAAQSRSTQETVQPTEQQLHHNNQYIIILDNNLQPNQSTLESSLQQQPNTDISDWKAQSSNSQQNYRSFSSSDLSSGMASSVRTASSSSKRDERTGRRTPRSDGLDVIVETADFFSMVENMPSPSERLRGLSLASPPSGFGPQDGGESSDRFQTTINEESLKQLLYNMPL